MLEVFSKIPREFILNTDNLETGGKYTIVEFWTSSDLRCRITSRFLQKSFEMLPPGEFTVIGVHTPEFQFEKEKDLIRGVIQREGLKFPNLLDNDYYIWSYFNNQFWPAVYIFNKNGELIHEFVENLELSELQKTLEDLSGARFGNNMVTTLPVVETRYLGKVRGELSNSPVLIADGISNFEVPDSTELPGIYLSGPWIVSQEYVESGSLNCSLTIHNRFISLHVVAGSNSERVISLNLNTGNKVINIKEPGIYNIMDDQIKSEKRIKINISEGVRIYSLTFG